MRLENWIQLALQIQKLRNREFRRRHNQSKLDYLLFIIYLFITLYFNNPLRQMSKSDQISEADFGQFITAIKNAQFEKVEQILKRTSPQILNKTEPTFNQPPIYSAALTISDETSAEMLKLLIRNGANYRFKDNLDQTVLFYVLRQGKEQCAQILLSHGLNIDEADSNGQTPLFYAVGQNRLELVKKYATKERVNHVDNLAGQTPLYYAARNGHLQMCKLLIEKGADVTHVDQNNKTAVDFAKKSKYYDIAQFLSSQLKRTKQTNKFSMPSQSIQESNLEKRKKKEELKPIRQTYKIVYLDERGISRDLTEEDVRQMGRQHPQLEKYLSNPESIPQQLIDKSNGELWQKTANKIIAQCFKLKGSYWFQEAVDPIKFNILDYFEIIKKPMDLSTVRKKVTHNSYANVDEFIADMRLIWQNCYKYNGESHDISKCAKELETNFLEYCRSYGLDKYKQAE